MTANVTVVIPTTPHRPRSFLVRAMRSVLDQTTLPAAVLVTLDREGLGPGPTRQRGLEVAATEYVAFLDDDDELLPRHLAACLRVAVETGADLVYPTCERVGPIRVEVDPFGALGHPFDPARLQAGNYIPVTVLARTEALRAAGGFSAAELAPRTGANPCEDWGLWLRLLDAGGTFAPAHEVTWRYHVHGGNYAGHRVDVS